MLPSLAQLQKILETEISHKYGNKAIIGGLPKLLSFWVQNARRDGIDEALLDGLAVRVRAYPELPVDKRPLAIAELLDLLKEANAATMAKKQAASAPAPARPAPPPAPRPDRPPSGEARDENRRPRPAAEPHAPRPERPREENRRPRPEPSPAAPPPAPSASEPPAPPAATASETKAPEPRPAPAPAPRPAERPGGKREEQRQRATSPQAEAPRRRPEGSPMQLEPLDPRPRRQSGPKPLKAAEPIEPQAALDAPLTVLRGVGPETSKDYAKLGLLTLRDLLLYFPRRYDNYAKMKTINRLEYGEECTIIASVRSVFERRFAGSRTMLKVVLEDGTGALEVTEFRSYLKNTLLVQGRQVVVSGRVDQYLGRLTIKPGDWEKLDTELLNTGRIVPVYRLTEDVYQRSLRNLTAQVVNFWARKQPDPLPAEMVQRAGLMAYGEALAQIHYPDNEAALAAAQHRLAFDELLALQIGVLRQRRHWQAVPGQPLPVDDAWLTGFQAALPYPLTGAQSRALTDLRADLSRPVPMNRLLQGDVGSGKTAVAAVAMAIAVQGGAQAALMAPTSILAEQHYKTVAGLLRPLLGEDPAALRLLQGSTSAAEKNEIYAGLQSGAVKVVVGTHALIEAPVDFADLGLVVIDEQHRFGVAQRAALRGKGGNPHLLVMTATPIPRTLALSVYGDLDLSILDEMPPGRQPITTYLLHAHERERAYHFVRREIQKGRQAFIIFPLVEESERVEAKAAVEEHARLQRDIFPDLRLGLLHGRLKPAEKDEVMARFRAGEDQILVATSVVEVGVDVPNASVIMIDGANRFGLAQLHQFRGRVGRGEFASYCLLVSDAPHAETDERLKAMEATQDGFVLAQKDLDLRGPGDFLGTRQSGFAELRSAKLSDLATIEKARREAQAVFDRDPDLAAPEHQGLAALVDKFWANSGDVS